MQKPTSLQRGKYTKYRITTGGRVNTRLWNEGLAACKVLSFCGFYLIKYTLIK